MTALLEMKTKKEIWVRIGDYGSFLPFTTYSNIAIEKNDPVINVCLQRFKQYLLNGDIKIEEPIYVMVREEEKDTKLDYKLEDLK